MSDTADRINDLRGKVGPKRVKTPQIETEQFDLDQLDRLAEKTNPVKPTFQNMLFSIAVPKWGCDCTRREDDCCG